MCNQLKQNVCALFTQIYFLKFYKNQSFDDLFIYLWFLSTHLTKLIGSKCHSYTPIDQIHCQGINLDYLIPICAFYQFGELQVFGKYHRDEKWMLLTILC